MTSHNEDLVFFCDIQHSVALIHSGSQPLFSATGEHLNVLFLLLFFTMRGSSFTDIHAYLLVMLIKSCSHCLRAKFFLWLYSSLRVMGLGPV